MEKTFFTKMNGAGNDFIFFDRDEFPALNLTPESIQRLCHRRFGIGADGILTLRKDKQYDFDLEYYNSDGSTGSLCGNGARCAIMYAYRNKMFTGSKTEFTFKGDGYSGEVIDEYNTKFNLNDPSGLKRDLILELDNYEITADYINTGSPHLVIDVSNVKENSKKVDVPLSGFPVYDFGKSIRYHDKFKPDGTNVNFIEMIDNVLHIRTYERGVEDETLACGTGSTAAALIASLKMGLEPPVKLVTRSGVILGVDFIKKNDNFNQISLSGPAEINFEGEIYADQYFNTGE